MKDILQKRPENSMNDNSVSEFVAADYTNLYKARRKFNCIDNDTTISGFFSH